MKHDEPGEIVVRGRDFTAYRIGGAIVAVLLAIALIFQVWELFDGDARTVPEFRWSAAEDETVRRGKRQRSLAPGEFYS